MSDKDTASARPWYDRLGIRFCRWLYKQEIAERKVRFEKRLSEDPSRELTVQTVRKMILEHHEDEEGAALAIVEHFFPKHP